MDDQTLRALDERLSYLRKLDDQKETVHNSITEQGRDDAGDRRRAGKGQNAGGG